MQFQSMKKFRRDAIDLPAYFAAAEPDQATGQQCLDTITGATPSSVAEASIGMAAVTGAGVAALRPLGTVADAGAAASRPLGICTAARGPE